MLSTWGHVEVFLKKFFVLCTFLQQKSDDVAAKCTCVQLCVIHNMLFFMLFILGKFLGMFHLIFRANILYLLYTLILFGKKINQIFDKFFSLVFSLVGHIWHFFRYVFGQIHLSYHHLTFTTFHSLAFFKTYFWTNLDFKTFH